MVFTTVAMILPGAHDPVFGEITAVFAKKNGEYALYRTSGRILIQYADAPTLEAAQRTAIAPLGPLRSEINAMIDGWRASWLRSVRNRATQIDRRAADALVIGLENNSSNAVLELNKVRNAIIDEQTSFARFVYLLIALAMALIVGVSVATLAFAKPGLCTAWLRWDDVLIAILGGLAGSFFSIATGLSKRTILPKAVGLDNILDAILRMLIGIISAGILICLLHGGLSMTFVFARQADPKTFDATLPVAWMQLITIGFLAGFSERLVPDLLEKAGQSVQPTLLPADKPLETPVLSTPPDLKMAKAGVVDDGTGDCASDTPLTEAEATADIALPAATGGTL